MAEARGKDRWSHTSHLMALLANIHRNHRRRLTAFRPADFNPHMSSSAPSAIRVTRDNIDVLKVFLPKKKE